MSEERQYQLEEDSVTIGAEKYGKATARRAEVGAEDQNSPSQALIRRSLKVVAEAIDLDRNKVRRGKNRGQLDLFRGIESEVLAWHGIRGLLSTFTKTPSYTQQAVSIGNSIQEELNFRKFKDEEARKYQVTQKYIEHARSGSRKRGIMNKMFDYSDIDVVKWSPKDRGLVGAYILDIVIQVTGWVTVRMKKTASRRTTRVISATQEMLDWFEAAHSQLSILTPVRLPMLVAPRPWSSTYGGGYLSDLGGRIGLVKSLNTEYLAGLNAVDMPEFYASLNAIQNTAWKINTAVLDVAQAVYDEGVMIGKAGHESLPSRSPLNIVSVPAEWEGKVGEWKIKDNPAFKLWTRKAAAAHEEAHRLVSKRLTSSSKINIAERFRDEEAIWFPHNVDFRGRVYPIPIHLNPQGDDIAKALLTFADGKRLGADGVTWLKVHTANCFGVDKISFEERIQWVDEHMDQIMDSGFDPLDGDRFWTTADDPFLALAACFEILGWSFEGEDYVSHLPVSMDGSCNGLQNFSALLRDETGGKATNLIPSEVPADIYQEVADVVATKVRKGAEAGDATSLKFDGFISRTLIKSPVMTLPYGATRSGMQNQIEAAVKKMGNPMSLGTSDSWTAYSELAKTTYDSIGEVVVAARSAMDWLQDVARAAAAHDFPIHWTTPVGLPVLQEYRKQNSDRLCVHINGVRAELAINVQGTKLDRRRQTLGISPNFIHSLDAAHMMKTVLLANANGIESFAMIHDSYGCHAADIPLMHQVIRTAFIEQYSGDLLGEFRSEVESQLPPDIELPELPEMGNLDLSLIQDSKYFFA